MLSEAFSYFRIYQILVPELRKLFSMIDKLLGLRIA